MRHCILTITLLLMTGAAGIALDAAAQEAQDQPRQDEIVRYAVDTPFYTLQGPEAPMVALIQTDMEVEYIGDYLELDVGRAKKALRLLEHVNFAEGMLLVVNGGPIEGSMLRIEAVYEQYGELHVVVGTDDPPSQHRDSGFASPASNTLTPSLVAVLPRYQGPLVVHVYPADWAVSGDLRGVQIIIVPPDVGEDPDDRNETPDSTETDG
jgi:hypothetical protein